jgi:hypothetical protein
MEEIIYGFASVIGSLYFDYIFASVVLNYFIVKYFLPNRMSRTWVAIVTCIISLCIALIFYFWFKHNPKELFISWISINAFYELIVRAVLKKFNIDYSESDPELLKPKKDNNPYEPMKSYKRPEYPNKDAPIK